MSSWVRVINDLPEVHGETRLQYSTTRYSDWGGHRVQHGSRGRFTLSCPVKFFYSLEAPKELPFFGGLQTDILRFRTRKGVHYLKASSYHGGTHDFYLSDAENNIAMKVWGLFHRAYTKGAGKWEAGQDHLSRFLEAMDSPLPTAEPVLCVEEPVKGRTQYAIEVASALGRCIGKPAASVARLATPILGIGLGVFQPALSCRKKPEVTLTEQDVRKECYVACFGAEVDLRHMRSEEGIMQPIMQRMLMAMKDFSEAMHFLDNKERFASILQKCASNCQYVIAALETWSFEGTDEILRFDMYCSVTTLRLWVLSCVALATRDPCDEKFMAAEVKDATSRLPNLMEEIVVKFDQGVQAILLSDAHAGQQVFSRDSYVKSCVQPARKLYQNEMEHFVKKFQDCWKGINQKTQEILSADRRSRL